MSIDSIKAPISTIQGSQSVVQVDMGIRVIGLMQGICSLLIILALIVGIIYIIKSKKTIWKKILIGAVIILVPFIINWILSMIKFNMLLNV